MTVNIGLVTSDALVLGCDSVASTIQPFVDPFAPSVELVKDANGMVQADADGRYHLKFKYENIQQVVTSAWGGVTKMFPVHPKPSPVVAITAGLALLEGRTIASHAEEFFRRQMDKQQGGTGALVNVEPICNAFLRFMRRRYEAHYKDSQIPDSMKEGLEFLVGGIGRDDTFPSLYRVSVQRNSIVCDWSQGQSGMSWNGQADAVERLVRGYDGSLRMHIESSVAEAIRRHAQELQEYVIGLVNGIMDELNQELPDDVEIELPTLKKVDLNWGQFAIPIDYRNLPLQEAVNLVSAMVMSQASRARFAWGIATVGGRTHIGVVTKTGGFEALNEPELIHRFTGLSDDV